MEQITNRPELSLVRHDRDPAAPWRSLGSLAAVWVARAEAEKLASRSGATSFEALAWAAE